MAAATQSIARYLTVDALIIKIGKRVMRSLDFHLVWLGVATAPLSNLLLMLQPDI